MLLDLRYHAASLIAVFLALALGIVIGGSLASDETLVRYQENLIARLEAETKALRAKQEIDESSLLALRQERQNLEKQLDSLAINFFNELNKNTPFKVQGSDTLLGMKYETNHELEHEILFNIQNSGELAEKALADSSAVVVEVPKNIKLWELALYISTIKTK